MPSPADQYRLLVSLSQKISRTLDLQELLRHLLESVRAAVPFDAAGVFVLNRSVRLGLPEGGHLIAGVAAIGFPPGPRDDDPDDLPLVVVKRMALFEAYEIDAPCQHETGGLARAGEPQSFG